MARLMRAILALSTCTPVGSRAFLTRRARLYARPMLRRVRTVDARPARRAARPDLLSSLADAPGLDCVVLLNNIESRFTSGREGRGLDAMVTQLDSEGRVSQPATRHAVRQHRRARGAAGAGRRRLWLRDGGRAPDQVRPLRGARRRRDVHRDARPAVSSSSTIRPWTRAILAVAGALLAPLGHTVPAFARDQYVYHGADSRSHLLVLNLSNVVNRVRVVARARRRAGRRPAESASRREARGSSTWTRWRRPPGG